MVGFGYENCSTFRTRSKLICRVELSNISFRESSSTSKSMAVSPSTHGTFPSISILYCASPSLVSSLMEGTPHSDGRVRLCRFQDGRTLSVSRRPPVRLGLFPSCHVLTNWLRYYKINDSSLCKTCIGNRVFCVCTRSRSTATVPSQSVRLVSLVFVSVVRGIHCIGFKYMLGSIQTFLSGIKLVRSGRSFSGINLNDGFRIAPFWVSMRATHKSHTVA